MRNLRRASRAVAGFFEEIPAAAVVLVSLTLFSAALAGGLKAHNEQQAASNFSAQAESFLEGLVDYQNLTYLGQSGVFEAAKVVTLTVSNITYDFHPPFQYQVSVTDISNYTAKYATTLGTAPLPTLSTYLKVGEVRDSTTVDIWVPTVTFGEYHAAVLSVVIWE